MGAEPTDWQTLLFAEGPDTVEHWREESPGCWVGTTTADDEFAYFAVVAETDLGPSWIAQTHALSLGEGPRRYILLHMHNLMADMISARELRVVCAFEDCGEVWPCPKREAWARPELLSIEGGEQHRPKGVAA
jgi:hypothetical protein